MRGEEPGHRNEGTEAVEPVCERVEAREGDVRSADLQRHEGICEAGEEPLEPPKTAAMTPATIAVIKPLSAPAPELTPNANANANGRATIPTVTPATRSPRHVRRTER